MFRCGDCGRSGGRVVSEMDDDIARGGVTFGGTPVDGPGRRLMAEVGGDAAGAGVSLGRD